MEKLSTLLLFVVGVINFLPVIGILSAARLSQAYAIELDGSDLEILMRHRALLFGIVGGFILYSVFVPAYQTPAMIMAAVSMVGYIFFTWQVGGYNDSLQKVMLVDIGGIACLMGAVLFKVLSRGPL